MLGKVELLEMLSPQDRGLRTSSTEGQAIGAAIARLEDRNPTPEPLNSPDLEGDWRLLYTTSQELLGIGRWPLLQLGPIYQCVRLSSRCLYNFAEVLSPLTAGLVTVAASLEPVSAKRVNVAFERGILGLQPLLGYRSPSQFIQRMGDISRFSLLQGIDFPISSQRQGWLEITYLDADLRIGRGNEGSVFVLRKG